MKLEDAWRDILEKVNYAVMGDEMKRPVEEHCDDIDTGDTNSVRDDNVDGFIISNLGEKTTREDIVSVLKSIVNSEDLEKFTVHPTGSTRSKLIKDINKDKINAIVKFVDMKSYQGRLLHCRPHVPMSPQKKSEAKEDTSDNDDKLPNVQEDQKSGKFEEVTRKKTPSKLVKKPIPGLPPKAEKKASQKKAKDEKKKKSDDETKVKAKSLTKKEFLKKNNTVNENPPNVN